MWALIWKWIADNYPLFIVGAVIFFGGYKVRELYQRLQKTEKECDKIEDKIFPTLVSLDKSIHALITFLTTKHNDLQIDLFKANSPIQLTDLGAKILEAIGGKKYVDDNVNYLIGEISKEDLKSGLDVERFSKSILMREINSNAFTPIKNYIFNNPIYTSDTGVTVHLNLVTVNDVIGIYLRDRYFQLHPELKDSGSTAV